MTMENKSLPQKQQVPWTFINVLLFDLPVLWWPVLPGTAELQREGCAVQSWAVHEFLAWEEWHLNHISEWAALELVWEVHMPSKAQGFNSENYLGDNRWLRTTYQSYSSRLLRTPSFWGWEFIQDLVGVLRSVHLCVVRYVREKCFYWYLPVCHVWQKPAVLFLLVLMSHTPHVTGPFSYHAETCSSISSLSFACTE